MGNPEVSNVTCVHSWDTLRTQRLRPTHPVVLPAAVWLAHRPPPPQGWKVIAGVSRGRPGRRAARPASFISGVTVSGATAPAQSPAPTACDAGPGLSDTGTRWHLLGEGPGD